MDAARRAGLERAYRRTTYRAGARRLRIGEPVPALDAHEAWAYLTAWNPGARQRPDAENERAMDALRERLRATGLAFHEGAAESDDGSWPPEPSLLVLGIAPDEAAALGRAFGQVAIVVGRRGGVAELLWL